MSAEWREHKFGELCDISRGASPRPIKDYISDEGMPWVKIADATASGSKFITKTKEKIKLEGVSKSVTVRPGDLILSNSATPGLPRFMKIEACIHDGWMLLKNFRGLDKEFAYWLLLHERMNLVAQGNGSVFTNLKTDILRNHRVSIPELKQQKAIAKLLNSLSDKIQNTVEINQTLEQMAQTIFKSWFVDFEPAKAKIAALEAGGSEEDALRAAMQAMSGKGEVELTRLQAEQPEQYAELRASAELFPLAMQDSELGEIPEEWEVLPLSEMVELIGGGTPKKSEPSFWNGDICWFSVKDAPKEGNVFVVDTEDKITEEGLNRSSTKLLPLGTTIITARGTVGKLALAGIPTAMNQSCYGVVGNDGTGPYLNYLRLQRAVDNLQQNTHGAVFDTITRSTFEAVNQARACLALRQRFEQLVQPLFDAIKNNVLHSDTLCATRDSLLPKLLSGELTIQEHESEFARATEV